MQLGQYLSDLLTQTSDTAIPTTIIVTTLAAIRAAIPKLWHFIRNAKTVIRISRPNGSGMDFTINPTTGATDFHVSPPTKKDPK